VPTKIRARGISGRLVFLAEAKGAPADLVAASGGKARTYADHLTPAGLARMAAEVDGVSVSRKLLLKLDLTKNAVGVTDLVARAHAVGLIVFCWTLRAENKFLAKNNRVRGEVFAYGNWRREFELLYSSGVDGVFADQPDLALAARPAAPLPNEGETSSKARTGL